VGPGRLRAALSAALGLQGRRARLRDRLGARVELVPNGWDPELLDGTGPAASSPLGPDRASIVYTGRLAIVDRDPRVLVEALGELGREEPELAARLELVFAGSYTDEERELFATDVSPARILLLGHLPRAEALALQREADALLLVTSGRRRHEVTGKVFEYLGAGRPIVALAGDDEAARVVRDARAGVVVAPGDREGAKRVLRLLARDELQPPEGEALGRYAYPAVAERMARLVEEAIAGRARPA
jgi:glycosyltransferase involved in cell wall biosynthesis